MYLQNIGCVAPVLHNWIVRTNIVISIDRHTHTHTHKQTNKHPGWKHYHLAIAGDNEYRICHGQKIMLEPSSVNFIAPHMPGQLYVLSCPYSSMVILLRRMYILCKCCHYCWYHWILMVVGGLRCLVSSISFSICKWPIVCLLVFRKTKIEPHPKYSFDIYTSQFQIISHDWVVNQLIMFSYHTRVM